MKRLRFKLWLGVGLCLSGLWACSSLPPIPGRSIQSFESADRYLHQRLLPKVQVESQLVSDTSAYSAVIPPLADAVPDPNTYPLHGAQPTSNAEVVYIEIYSSAEKANGNRADERWLVDVAEAFNQRRQTLPSGQVIQVGVRNIPSGLGAQIIAAKKGKPAGYTPAHELWLELLKADGVAVTPIAPALVANQAIFALQPQVYETLFERGEVTFDRVVAAILAGEFEVGFCNPYIASPALNFLHTLLWRAAGHDQTGAPLQVEDLDNPAVNSVFAAFQQQIALTTPTYLDLKQIWRQDPDAFQAIIMSRQSFVNLKKEPEFAHLVEIPFGVPETSPLVAFDWTSPAEREALKAFAAFATAAPMQEQAIQQGHVQTDYLKQGNFPPLPSGEVLKAAQAFWKQRKDGGRTVYMELVVDTSGSMDQNNRLKAVQEALRFASQQINPGNQIGLVTFSDRAIRRIHLAPFNELEQKRLFTAINQLQPDGATALYDGLAVALAELMEMQKTDPDGQFCLLLLTDGDRTDGLKFNQIKEVIRQSGVRVYPIAYGEVNHRELAAIAAIRESAVYEGTPEKVQVLLRDLFQTNL
ncbi:MULTISPECIES: vWA domain-containing protein [Cyanophyceae]|uniref:vWA domain-containing protein n=1 Tax=Cyanophyceae TaxID=3028117 RepID=UPI001688DAD5|nr:MULTISPECIES: vWA domain-containing protein [Cyanophyceae]MBD1916662.1 VWA domain-containing protein [Phormidium sp. FACHB-77]MBD2030019.1 VWA domain-containing protein [Phormidium sp. FACHB-322]MBD2053230.1 VWA domain-containing protein [Leptolyngbya sp. FACHB-60]